MRTGTAQNTLRESEEFLHQARVIRRIQHAARRNGNAGGVDDQLQREMQQIAKLIDRVIASSGDQAVALRVKEEVLDLTNRFPLYKSFPSMAETK